MKTMICAVAVSLFLATSARAEDNGVITGKVALTGTPPPEREEDFGAAKECRDLHPDGLKSRRYIVATNGGLANCFVFVKAGAKDYPPPAQAVKLGQKSCLYTPYVVGVQVGQELEISK